MDKIKKIILPIKEDMDVFESKLKNITNSCDNFLKDDLISFMFSNQKRLRPIFVILFSKILNIESVLVQKIAVISELIHSASLIHDDVIDEEKIRRNNIPFYKKYDSKTAILLGDWLLAKSLEILSDTNFEISKIFSKRILLTITGEIEQNSSLFKLTDENQYIEKTFQKTGNLFLAGIESLFTMKEINSDIQNFMINYSTAFQIKNDIKDIKEDSKLGNYTLAMLYYLKDNMDINEAKKLAVSKMLEYKNKALFFAQKIEKSIFQKTLIELCEATIGE